MGLIHHKCRALASDLSQEARLAVDLRPALELAVCGEHKIGSLGQHAAIWVRGTIRAMLYGTVTRAWAKQHHRAWYKQMTGK